MSPRRAGDLSPFLLVVIDALEAQDSRERRREAEALRAFGELARIEIPVLAEGGGRIRGIRSTTGAKPALMVPIVSSAWSNSAYRSRCSDTLRRRSGKSQPRRDRAGGSRARPNVTRERRSAPLTRPRGRAELKDRSDAP